MSGASRPGEVSGIAAAITVLLGVALLCAALAITFTTGFSGALGARPVPLTAPIILTTVSLILGVLALLAGLGSAVMVEGRNLGLLWAGLALILCAGSALLLPSLLDSQT